MDIEAFFTVNYGMYIVSSHYNRKLNGQIVNIGNPNNEVSIKELAKLMIRIYNNETNGKFTKGTQNISAQEFYGLGYADCDRRIPDSSKIFKLGWNPKFDLDETFRETIKYYLTHNDLVG